jgi:hypothetical protein
MVKDKKMKAMIDPMTTNIQHISSWAGTPPNLSPVFSAYPNSARVAQVEPDADIFPVAEPYFWTVCADNVIADQFYYDTVTKTINLIVNAPRPAADDQPATTNIQTA